MTFPRLLPRFLLLGTGLLLLLCLGVPGQSASAAAQPAPAAVATPAPADASAESSATPDRPSKGITATIKIDTDPDAATDADDDAAGGPPSITVDKGGKRVRLHGLGPDRDFESVGDFISNEPKLAGITAMVVLVVAIVFLSPVLLAALIIGYRIRKTRMTNETMLKLAEKGVMPPAAAMASIAEGRAAADLAAPASPAAMREQVRQVQKRAAWSDLRKGIVMGAIGLGLMLASVLEDGTSNGFGLVLLFLGIGYVLLWWFEERQIPRPGDRPGGDGA